MPTVLRLDRHWTIGDAFESGGFGTVFEAECNGETAVAKFVIQQPGAERELLFADLDNVTNVVPILDSGAHEDSWVLIMPRADYSLRDYLDRHPQGVTLDDSLQVVIDVATALESFDSRVVHRDIKPENILFLNGVWCIADFGISRYTEATTSPNTRKSVFTDEYAAPEQWNHQRATAATDIYSLGVLWYELLARRRPFDGPNLRDQHLTDPPTAIEGIPSAIQSLVIECLYKAPGARPSASNILKRINAFRNSPTSLAINKLQDVNLVETKIQAEMHGKENKAREEARNRSELYNAASAQLSIISDELKLTIVTNSPITQVEAGSSGLYWSANLGKTKLEFAIPTVTKPNPWGNFEAPSVDVIAHAAIVLVIPMNRLGQDGMEHSLWFCDAEKRGEYGWYEIGFQFNPIMSSRSSRVPFMLNPSTEAAKALWRGISEFNVKFPFRRLSIGELEDFQERWIGWFADAAKGRLPDD